MIVNGLSIPDDETELARRLEGEPELNRKGTLEWPLFRRVLELTEMTRGIAVDVGAGCGIWTRMMACYFREVLAFEPVAMYRTHLWDNIDGHPNVRVFDEAMGAGPEVWTGVMDGVYLGAAWSWFVEPGLGAAWEPNAPKRREAVEVNCLDRAFGCGISETPDVDLLRIAAGGYEYFVLRGGELLIRTARPVIILKADPALDGRYLECVSQDCVALLDRSRLDYAPAGNFGPTVILAPT